MLKHNDSGPLPIDPVPYEFPKYMSPSSISTFQQCPLKYKYAKLDKLPVFPQNLRCLGLLYMKC